MNHHRKRTQFGPSFYRLYDVDNVIVDEQDSKSALGDIGSDESVFKVTVYRLAKRTVLRPWHWAGTPTDGHWRVIDVCNVLFAQVWTARDGTWSARVWRDGDLPEVGTKGHKTVGDAKKACEKLLWERGYRVAKK